jgi:hypothetical protein
MRFAACRERDSVQLRAAASAKQDAVVVEDSPLATLRQSHAAQLEALRARHKDEILRLEERERRLIDGHNAKTARLRKEQHALLEKLGITPSVPAPPPLLPCTPSPLKQHALRTAGPIPHRMAAVLVPSRRRKEGTAWPGDARGVGPGRSPRPSWPGFYPPTRGRA